MNRREVKCLLVLCLSAGCAPEVSLGSDGVSSNDTKECEWVTAPAIACPAKPWGAPVSLDTAEGLEQRLLGRWAFCGGEKRYSGRGELLGFSNGAGIELWKESGELQYAFLDGTPQQLSRAQEPSRSGIARLMVSNQRGQAVLVAHDGEEVVWNTDLFDGQPVLQNAAFDVWNFVALK